MKCPGQDTRYWKPGDIFEVPCPGCDNRVEFFKDETRRKCPACKQTVLNPRIDFGCAAYCRYAADCLGEVGPELAGQRDDLLKDRVAVEVKRSLGSDFRKIAHGVRVARLAEQIGREEKATLGLVLCAAFLHLFYERGEEDLPMSDADGERRARAVLDGLGARMEIIEKTLELTRSFLQGSEGGSTDEMVFHDAHLVARLEEGGTREGVEREFRTAAGRALAATRTA